MVCLKVVHTLIVDGLLVFAALLILLVFTLQAELHSVPARADIVFGDRKGRQKPIRLQRHVATLH